MLIIVCEIIGKSRADRFHIPQHLFLEFQVRTREMLRIKADKTKSIDINGIVILPIKRKTERQSNGCVPDPFIYRHEGLATVHREQGIAA